VRPWIGIVGELASRADGTTLELRLSRRYAEAVERAGGLPLALLPLADEEALAELLDRIDGLVFAGADDFDTERLGLGPTHPRAKPVPREKQDFDLLLARLALAQNLPTLGICYGMQLLALAEGGGLHQHLPEDRPGRREHAGGVRHAVQVRPATKLRACTGVATLDVVSRHHQAVSSVSEPWVVAGVDDEELIEAIERKGHPFALGVQWHPELSSDPAQARIFSGLVEAARRQARSRLSPGLRP